MTELVDQGLPGRAAEERAIRTALRESAGGPRALALVGEAGIGKTSLLRRGITMARAGGFLVVGGRSGPGRAEQALLEAAARLPEPVRRPLARLVAGDPVAPGPVSLRMAVLTVVDALSRRRPVLIVLDDVALPDRETISLLTFVTRRLPGRRVVVLLAGRGIAAFGSNQIRLCPVAPLPATAAAGLLDALPHPPAGRVRAEILRLARGNPDVLRRLTEAAAAAADPFGPDFRLPAGGDALGEIPAGLPAATSRLLLTAAATEDGDLGPLLTAARAGLPDCRPAEEAGLISVVAGRLTFRHPMIRARSYFGAAPDDRRAAHAALVAALPSDAPLRDWHAAHLVRPADDGAAAAFERAAEAAASRGSGLDAAAMLERGAECGPDDREAARLYGRAAAEADRSGDIAWTRDLWRRMRNRTGDPAAHATTAAELGNAAMFRTARPVLGEVTRMLAAPLTDAALGPALLSLAARVVLSDGRPADVATLRRLINRSGPDRRDPACFRVALADAVADPAGWASRHGPLPESPLMEPLRGSAERARLMSVAGIAWVTDDAEIAADHYRRALRRTRADRAYGVSALATVAFTEVLLECGLTAEAADALREAADFVGGNRFAVARRALTAQQASLLIRRGDLDEARALLDRDAAAGPVDSRLVRYLHLRATGQLAAAAGDADRACTEFRRMFEPDGTPVHYLMSQRSIVELAAAAGSAGRQTEIDGVLRVARARAPRPTGRREWSWKVASAMLHPDDDAATRRMAHLLATPGAADRWPHEYAIAQTAGADRLRTGRQYTQARPLLVSALDILVRVGATHQAATVREKLRSVGVRAPDAAEPLFAALTPQQQLIARLAADGLSNRDISARLRIAPRTVGFHLYHIFPKLGITRRTQLRGAVLAA